MNIEEFLNLSEQDQERIIVAYKARKDILRQYSIIRSDIEEANTRLLNLQERCTHPMVKIKQCSDTGNWCKSDDQYWTEYDCPDCGKKWSLDA